MGSLLIKINTAITGGVGGTYAHKPTPLKVQATQELSAVRDPLWMMNTQIPARDPNYNDYLSQTHDIHTINTQVESRDSIYKYTGTKKYIFSVKFDCPLLHSVIRY